MGRSQPHWLISALPTEARWSRTPGGRSLRAIRRPPNAGIAQSGRCAMSTGGQRSWIEILGAIVTDAEVRILSRNGPTSWRGALGVDGTDVLLRTNNDASFQHGTSVRILDLLANKSEDSDGLILTLRQGSEVFGPVDDRRSAP